MYVYIYIYIDVCCSVCKYIHPSLTHSHRRIPDLVKNKYATSHSAALKTLEEEIAAKKDITVALKGSNEDAQSTAATTSASALVDTPSTTRTVATPDFEGETVPVYNTRIELESKTLDEFNESRTFLA